MRANIFSILTQIPFLLLSAAMITCFFRLILGPTLPDRVVALDLLANLLISATVLYSIITNQAVYIDVVIALALIIFLGTVAFAKLIGWRKDKPPL
ncbi:monovalent cation/H+ antiporter complex subunit F [Legionella clemsonensis]|uniref:Na(+)/H(+) antiporter subunit F1 n=1 Tax=Legionella clemsonensis TaxID=1867846 RepID=A0A222P1M8_9GAMM|nr:monovalent cation/H+ antiporter complex subunit F [Legionella clemsonensis]ASQ45752.1 Na(+)/H(+) antiporter subunit F1 [Legionella clemsonensis]